MAWSLVSLAGFHLDINNLIRTILLKNAGKKLKARRQLAIAVKHFQPVQQWKVYDHRRKSVRLWKVYDYRETAWPSG